ncbi:MAG: 16S rRNA (cytosine(967)-C(5))-methyltransferase [Leptolyngbyaceae cyanobacterium bins.59]|nr:16S rRNA (cytosine(967)-C(5))-methyltransferase [Leptolyngbyaceae cyanobacterium bins.59]
MSQNPRQLAFLTLRLIYRTGFADVELDKALRQHELSEADRRLFTELVYGTVRRQRTLDGILDQLGKKKAQQQPADLRIILHLGLYQLRYLSHIPPSAAVDTTVELAKQNKFAGLAGLVNGMLRQYGRLVAAGTDPLPESNDPITHIGIEQSFPDWIVQVWAEQIGLEETQQLCEWLNRSPSIDLRINPLRTSIEAVEAAFEAIGVAVQRLPLLPQGLRLVNPVGPIQRLPGYGEGWWMVQDSSAQLVGHLLNPQPGEVIVDACAAPGGKTLHLAELMQDRGKVWACDRSANRLKKLEENATRLQLQSIQTWAGDSREFSQLEGQADRVLLDAPCSGLGTLHRHADARWRQKPETVAELATLQLELLTHATRWVKPGGSLVYATCTLHPSENERVIEAFLSQNSRWQIEPPDLELGLIPLTCSQGWVKVWPHRFQMDGFFMVRLRNVTKISDPEAE